MEVVGQAGCARLTAGRAKDGEFTLEALHVGGEGGEVSRLPMR